MYTYGKADAKQYLKTGFDLRIITQETDVRFLPAANVCFFLTSILWLFPNLNHVFNGLIVAMKLHQP